MQFQRPFYPRAQYKNYSDVTGWTLNSQLRDSVSHLCPEVVHQFVETLEGKDLDFILWLAQKRENTSCGEPEMILTAKHIQ